MTPGSSGIDPLVVMPMGAKMITHVIAEPAIELIRGPQRAASAGPRLTSIWAWGRRAYVRARSRRELLELPDHLLDDIGLTLDDVGREGSKPFWR